jgi:ATP-dependent Clp protease protease subunit
VSDGFLTIYDTMQYVKSPIKTICIGEAYSGAGIILSAGSKGMRYACPNSEVMLHAVQVEDMSGTTQDIQKESKRIKVLNQKLMEIIAHHTGQSLRKVKRDCREDKFFSAKEALEYGIIDYIIEPSKTIAVLKKN